MAKNYLSALVAALLCSSSAAALQVLPLPCSEVSPINGSRLPANGAVYLQGSLNVDQTTYRAATGAGEQEIPVSRIDAQTALASLDDVSGLQPPETLTLSCSGEHSDIPSRDYTVAADRDTTAPTYELIDSAIDQQPWERPVTEPPGVVVSARFEVDFDDNFGVAAYEIVQWTEGEDRPSSGQTWLTRNTESGTELGIEAGVEAAETRTECFSAVLIDYAQNRTPLDEEECITIEAAGCRCATGNPGAPLFALLGLAALIGRAWSCRRASAA